jgi:flagellar hook-basal body complex protein FliE
MTMPFVDAVSAYQRAASRDAIAGPTPKPQEPGGGFADALGEALGGAAQTLRQGEEMSIQAAVGSADLTEVVQAVGRAEMTLQTVVLLRDRVVQAYQDILRMPI